MQRTPNSCTEPEIPSPPLTPFWLPRFPSFHNHSAHGRRIKPTKHRPPTTSAHNIHTVLPPPVPELSGHHLGNKGPFCVNSSCLLELAACLSHFPPCLVQCFPFTQPSPTVARDAAPPDVMLATRANWYPLLWMDKGPSFATGFPRCPPISFIAFFIFCYCL